MDHKKMFQDSWMDLWDLKKVRKARCNHDKN